MRNHDSHGFRPFGLGKVLRVLISLLSIGMALLVGAGWAAQNPDTDLQAMSSQGGPTVASPPRTQGRRDFSDGGFDRSRRAGQPAGFRPASSGSEVSPAGDSRGLPVVPNESAEADSMISRLLAHEAAAQQPPGIRSPRSAGKTRSTQMPRGLAEAGFDEEERSGADDREQYFDRTTTMPRIPASNSTAAVRRRPPGAASDDIAADVRRAVSLLTGGAPENSVPAAGWSDTGRRSVSQTEEVPVRNRPMSTLTNHPNVPSTPAAVTELSAVPGYGVFGRSAAGRRELNSESIQLAGHSRTDWPEVRHAAEFQFSRRPDVPAFLPAVRSVSSDVFPASVLTAQGTPENTGVTPTVGREVRTSVSGGDVGAALQAAAIAVAIQYETAQGRQVKHANGAQQGFDLVSRRPHPYDPQTCVDVRFISVKGYRDTTGLIITLEEMSLAEQLQDDYWVYGVMDCDTSPRVLALQNPHRQVLRPVTDIRHYVFDETGRGN